MASVVGALAAGAALRWAQALWVAWAAAAVLFVCPTLSGHALDGDQPRLLAPLGDLLHLGAAAVWLGGLASLLLAFPASAEPARTTAARRFSSFAIPMVLVLVAGGVSRALTQLDSLSQLWETSYGRTLLVKSGLLLVLVALGWLNRGRLAAGFARMRPIVIAELLVLLVVVGAVGVLTDLRPGSARATTPPATTPPPPVAQPPPAPPPGAFVDAGQAGKIAVGFAYDDGKAIVTLTDGSGDGVTDTPVTIDGAAGESCGRGCFSRAVPGPGVTVDVGGTPLQFAVPQYLRRATAEVNRLRLDYNASEEPRHRRDALVRPRQPAGDAVPPGGARKHGLPDRRGLEREARRHRGHRDRRPPLGQAAGRRLDRGAAVAARPAQGLLDERGAERVLHGAERDLVLRPDLPRVVPRALRPEDGACDDAADDATAHFMRHRYSGFDRPVSISPPPSR